VELEVRPEVLEVVVVRQLVGDVHAEGDGRFVGPTPGTDVMIFKNISTQNKAKLCKNLIITLLF
jgi:hypothetical protein